MSLKTLFPEITPFQTELFAVDRQHCIYVEQSGNPEGAPVIFVHGGPGCGCGDWARRFLDPDFYRIICIDQRGCGRSEPFLELNNNTIQDLAEDMEKVRCHLGIEKWLVHGGSWGTTLSLYYAETYPASVCGLILRGVFLGRQEDIDWLYQGGAGQFFPEAYAKFTSLLSLEEQKNNIASYYRYLTSPDKAIRERYGKAFADFENSVITLYPKLLSDSITDEDIAMATMETHYFINSCFMSDNYILENAHKIKNIPTIIIHGRYDVDCRPIGAQLLFEQLNKAEIIYTISGHSGFEPEITHALIESQEKFKSLF
ncbi:MAG: prolyl aminopeptidase [Streptococcus orisratti]|uniref:prolyl aminopeptidase n=1 Tax=Streptococcus orisratti TaxID=114652 RepID=UPI002A91A04A|nr:prolyl aminopeptidase [Streptococcus orisratti]MDY5636778.1 prolyl aminopeptidase [Streptococcus orisratti]